MYKGEYKNDKKDGYGIYRWADGRIYEGWWHKGKQYGLGKYINSEGNLMQDLVGLKYGLWENGKRAKWFGMPEVSAINSGDTSYTRHLKNPVSIELTKGQTFGPPLHFKFAVAN